MTSALLLTETQTLFTLIKARQDYFGPLVGFDRAVDLLLASTNRAIADRARELRGEVNVRSQHG